MRSPDESIDHGNFKYFFRVIVFAAAWPLEVDDPSAYTDGDGVAAITRVQFLHDMFDVNFDGLFRDKEFFRYPGSDFHRQSPGARLSCYFSLPFESVRPLNTLPNQRRERCEESN